MTTQEITYREAIVAALREEMRRDARTLIMGEDIGASGGPFKTCQGLATRRRPGITLRRLPAHRERQAWRSVMVAKAVIRMPGEGKAIILGGQPMAFLVTGEDTKHTPMFDWTVPTGFSTGLHVHRVQEETFYVLEGECEWEVGGQRIRATPGAYLFIPPGVPHHIGNASDKPARMLMTVSPPGHERYFEELAKVAVRGSAPDANVIAALRSRFDTDQLSALSIS
jgi:quercetin dioxygenase-like cupin family protein